jgi:serine/threonine protein kinase
LLRLHLLQAKPFADFLSQVLRWEPDSRATAEQLLQHPWLKPNEHVVQLPFLGDIRQLSWRW